LENVPPTFNNKEQIRNTMKISFVNHTIKGLNRALTHIQHASSQITQKTITVKAITDLIIVEKEVKLQLKNVKNADEILGTLIDLFI